MASVVEPQKACRMSDCRENYLDLHTSRCIGFTLIALGYVGVLYALQVYDPVTYAWLISEDSWIENATSAGFAVAAILIGRLAFQPGSRYQRAVWAMIAVVAAFVAMEEISWGQRIIGLDTPTFMKGINYQNEITIHNIEGVNYGIWKVWLAWGLIAWAVISIVTLMVRRRLNIDPMAVGLPIFPLRLMPFCLLVHCLIFSQTFVRQDEINELAIQTRREPTIC